MEYQMLAIGQFAFGMNTLAYQTLARQTTWRHPTNSRVGARPRSQYVGPDADTITLSGLLVPEFAGNAMSLDELRTMGDSGSSWPLVSGTGAVLGQFVLLNVQETQTLFLPEGVPRRIEFSLELRRTDDDLVDVLGADSGLNSNLA
jgi:hypothetical protein